MRNKATKKNMDLDLRRYGNNLYSKAEQSGGSDDGGSGGDGGGGDEPTEFVLRFKSENFGYDSENNAHANFPDGVDTSKGYTLDEIFEMSDNTLEKYISIREANAETYLEISNGGGSDEDEFGGMYIYDNQYSTNPNFKPFYHCLDVPIWRPSDDSYARINLGFIKSGSNNTVRNAYIQIQGTNYKGYSMSVMNLIFEKNYEDNKWYVVVAGWM
jgi:hypothetical protein